MAPELSFLHGVGKHLNRAPVELVRLQSLLMLQLLTATMCDQSVDYGQERMDGR